MSAAIISCPGCRAPLSITPDLVGKTIACPACRQMIQLAGAATPEPAPSAPVQKPLPRAKPIGGTPAQPLPSVSPQPAVAPSTGSHASSAVASYQSKKNSIGPAILVSWIVVVVLLIAAGGLIYGLRLRALAEEEAAAVVQAEQAAKAANRPQATPPIIAPVTPAANVPAAERSPPPGHSAAVTPRPLPPAKSPPKSRGPYQPAIAPMPPVTVSPAPVQPAPPPVPADPLAGLAEVWKLPTLISTQPEKMATLARDPSEPISLSIRSLAADVPAAGAIFTEAGQGGGWDVHFVSDLASGAGRVTLGGVRLEGREFSFAWAQPPADAALRRQLSNCLIDVRHGNTVKTAQLREPVRTDPWRIDLTEGVAAVEFAVPDPPKSDAVRLEIRELVGFPRDVALREEHKSIKSGQRALIQFTEMPGAEMGVQFVRLPSGAVSVKVHSEFRENSATKFELSLSRLASLEDAVGKALERARRELPGEQRLAVSLESDLKSVQATRPSNLAQQAARDQAIATLAGKLKRAVNKVGLLQKQIVESEGRLAAVPKMRSFLQSIDQKAQIRFVICAECGEQDLLLVDGLQAVTGAE